MEKDNWDETMEYLEILSQIQLTPEEKKADCRRTQTDFELHGKTGNFEYRSGGADVPCFSGKEYLPGGYCNQSRGERRNAEKCSAEKEASIWYRKHCSGGVIWEKKY